jgi:hypothetical protein
MTTKRVGPPRCAGAAQQHTHTETPTTAADWARRAVQMDARVQERTTNDAVALCDAVASACN